MSRAFVICYFLYSRVSRVSTGVRLQNTTRGVSRYSRNDYGNCILNSLVLLKRNGTDEIVLVEFLLQGEMPSPQEKVVSVSFIVIFVLIFCCFFFFETEGKDKTNTPTFNPILLPDISRYFFSLFQFISGVCTELK